MVFLGRVLLLLIALAVPCLCQLPSPEILSLLAFKKGITHDPAGFVTASWNEESIDFNGCPSSWNGIVCDGGGSSVAGIVLENHNLTGTVDISVFSNLTVLAKLSLANNALSGNLNVGGGFRTLQFLDVSNNKFSGPLPEGIGSLKNLQNLSLSGNNFSGTLPESLGDLIALQSLDLSRNSLSGPLPSGLKDLRNVVSLNLSYNAFTKGIPAGLGEIPSLQIIDMSWNELEGGVDWKFLTESKVTHVDFSGNSLSCSSPNELKFLSQISETINYLSLRHNKLTGSLLNEADISTFGRLKVLDLSYNQLSGDLPDFNYVYDLEVLRLGNNGFTGFVPSGLLKGDSLVLNELDLSSNNLTGHVTKITSTTLRVLNLSSNLLSAGVPFLTGSCAVFDLSNNLLSGNLSAMSRWGNDLEYVDLSRNNLTGVLSDTASQLLRLNYLNLSRNGLSGSVEKAVGPKLTVLDLSFNQFSGTISADLITSPMLQVLRLLHNRLSGAVMVPVSDVGKSSLRVLDISRNHFDGAFPNGFCFFSGLRVLNISANSFSGALPSAISNLTYLISLDISQNNFSGSLPAMFPESLLIFNASYNDLDGIVPPSLRKFPDSSFHPGNERLDVPLGSSEAGNGSSLCHKGLNEYAKIAVAVVGVVIFLILLFCVASWCHSRTSRKSPSERVSEKDVRQSSSGTYNSRDNAMVSADDLAAAPRKGSSSDVLSIEEKVAAAVTGYSPSKGSRFSWSPDSAEIYVRTNLNRLDVRSPDRLAGELHFLDEAITLTPEELSRAPAEVLGRSSRGTSYRATLDNDVFLTVKWLREGVAKPKKEFIREAKKFANVRHPNVVGLRGFYWGPTQHEKLILSDYVSPGSLAVFLYDRPGRTTAPLTWAQRLKIAVDVARGLNYLHLDRELPHGNLKASNILLEGPDLNARVADYCLHRLMTRSGVVEQILDAGALGYRAPELAPAKKPTPSFRSDIYAFGVVLLELLTGRCAGDVVSGEEGGVDLTDWVRLRVAAGRGSDCLEAAAAAAEEETSRKGMRDVLGVALQCIRPAPERPGIRAVYEELSSV